MEDLWRLKSMDYRVADLADQAEYARLLKRYHDEEQSNHRHHLLYRGERLSRPVEK